MKIVHRQHSWASRMDHTHMFSFAYLCTLSLTHTLKRCLLICSLMYCTLAAQSLMNMYKQYVGYLKSMDLESFEISYIVSTGNNTTYIFYTVLICFQDKSVVLLADLLPKYILVSHDQVQQGREDDQGYIYFPTCDSYDHCKDKAL